MSRIWLGDPEHGRMIAHRAGVGFDPDRDQVISRITLEGKLLGGFVYTNYNDRTIQVHMAGSVASWCSLKLLWLCFDYPFNQLNVEKVLAPVASTDEDVLLMCRRAGYRELTRIPGVVPGGDLVVLSMAREHCKWLRYRARYQRVEMAA